MINPNTLSVYGKLPIFDDKRFLPGNAGTNLLDSGLYVARGGSLLYMYKTGVYIPGEEELKMVLAKDMGSDWKPAQADAIIRWVLDTAPSLWERPPLGQINLNNGILDLETMKLGCRVSAQLDTIEA